MYYFPVIIYSRHLSLSLFFYCFVLYLLSLIFSLSRTHHPQFYLTCMPCAAFSCNTAAVFLCNTAAAFLCTPHKTFLQFLFSVMPLFLAVNVDCTLLIFILGASLLSQYSWELTIYKSSYFVTNPLVFQLLKIAALWSA